MSLFKSKTSTLSFAPFVSVICDIEAKVSHGVNFHTKNIEFEESIDGNFIAFRGRGYENGFNDSKRGMTITFRRDIQTGTYHPKDPNYPFEKFEYYESGANDDFTTYYIFKPESDPINVKVIASNSEKLCYLISFDFKGKDHRTEELHIVGTATLNVFKRSE